MSNLIDQIKAAAKRKMTPAEIQEQRIGFAFGNLHDSSTMTREDVAWIDYGQYGNLSAMEAEITRLRAELAEEQRISTVRGNHIELELSPQMADLTMRAKELEAELAAAREQVAGAYLAAADACADNTWRHEGEDAYSRGLDRGALEQASACAAHIRTLTTADAVAALEARDARVRAEERAQVIGEATAKILHECRTTLNGVSEYEAGTCADIVRTLHTTESRALASKSVDANKQADIGSKEGE